MITYKDRTYCATDINYCSNKKCTRHLKTTDRYYSPVFNIHNLPLSVSNFKEECKEYHEKDN